MEFYVPLSYQQIAFFKNILHGNIDETQFIHDAMILDDSILSLTDFMAHHVPQNIGIRPDNLQDISTLKNMDIKKIFLDNGTIQRKEIFTLKDGLSWFDKIRSYLNDINLFVIPDNPLWRLITTNLKEEMFKLNIDIAKEYLNILTKDELKKALFAIHCDMNQWHPFRIPTDLYFSYKYVAIPFRPKHSFRNRYNMIHCAVDKRNMHIMAYNSTHHYDIIKSCMSFDSAMYNLMAGTFNVMIKNDGTTGHVPFLNKQQKMILPLINAKNYISYLENVNPMEQTRLFDFQET